MSVSGKELIKELKKAGFCIVRSRRSHCILKKNEIVVVVPNHSIDLSKGLELSIRKKTGVYK